MWICCFSSLSDSSWKTISCSLDKFFIPRVEQVTQQLVMLTSRLFMCCSFSLWNILCNFRWFIYCHIVTFVLNAFYSAAFAIRKKLLLVGFLLLWFGVPFLFSFFSKPIGFVYTSCKVTADPGLFKCEKVRGPPFSRSWQNKVVGLCCSDYWESVAQECQEESKNTAT